jgi:enoyl-[acyl-carrier-protein] reductase (NADH)
VADDLEGMTQAPLIGRRLALASPRRSAAWHPSEDAATREAISKGIEEATLLGRAATLEDVGHAATFAASDWAPTMTGAALNISCGPFVD